MAALSTPRSESDVELMRRVQGDDSAAFGELYDRYADRAFRVAFSVCGDSGRAEDAVKDGFLSIWRSRATFTSSAGSFHARSMQAVRDRALQHAGSDGHDLIDALGHLPATQAEVIALAFFGELSHAEIARQLSLPHSTVRGRMRLGLNQLRGQLDVDLGGAPV